jgi:hypothetical protein
MAPKGGETGGSEPARNRCRCGHYPTTHMRVAPIGPGAGGSFRLDPEGPCAVCGEASCRRFTPAL